MVLPEQLGAAARLVGDREHAVDVGVVLLHVAELVLHELAHAGRAVHPRDDRDIVAGADPPVVSKVPVEISHLARRVERDRPYVRADLILLLQIAHRHVLGVHVITGGDVRGGEADGLPVAPHHLAHPPGPPRHLVAGPDVLPDLDAAARGVRARVLQDGAGGDVLLGDGHVVLELEDDRHVRDRVRRHVRALFSPSPLRGEGRVRGGLPRSIGHRRVARRTELDVDCPTCPSPSAPSRSTASRCTISTGDRPTPRRWSCCTASPGTRGCGTTSPGISRPPGACSPWTSGGTATAIPRPTTTTGSARWPTTSPRSRAACTSTAMRWWDTRWAGASRSSTRASTRRGSSAWSSSTSGPTSTWPGCSACAT